MKKLARALIRRQTEPCGELPDLMAPRLPADVAPAREAVDVHRSSPLGHRFNRIDAHAKALRGVAAGATVLSVLVVTIGAATVTPPSPGRVLSAHERAILATSLARREPAWQLEAERAFPGDLWSQDDDFFNREQTHLRELAQLFGTSPGQILRGVDEQLRAKPQGRKIGAHPCKPRPFYD